MNVRLFELRYKEAMRFVLCALLAACGSSTSEPGRSPGADRLAFLAVVEGAAADDVTQCRAIEEATLRGDCLSIAAARVAADAGDAAAGGAICDEAEGMWVDQCWLIVAQELEGKMAIEACAQADLYRQECESSVLTTILAETQDMPTGIGQELELASVFERQVLQMLDYREVTDDELDAYIEAAMIQVIVARWSEEIDLAACGDVPTTFCQEALREKLLADAVVTRRYAQDICNAAKPAQAIRQRGGTPWAEASIDRVTIAWRTHICSRFVRGGGGGQQSSHHQGARNQSASAGEGGAGPQAGGAAKGGGGPQAGPGGGGNRGAGGAQGGGRPGAGAGEQGGGGDNMSMKGGGR